MTKNVMCLTLCAMLFALSSSATAQQPKKVPRVGYLGGSATANPHRLEAFRRGLRDLGYVEGKNIALEYRLQREKMTASLSLQRTWFVLGSI